MRLLPVLAIAAFVPAQLSAAMPAQSGKTIPARFHGEWATAQAECMLRGGENSTGLRISAGEIRYYEESDQIRTVRMLDANSLAFTALLQSSDGEEPTKGTLRLSADGKRLSGSDIVGELVRCTK